MESINLPSGVAPLFLRQDTEAEWWQPWFHGNGRAGLGPRAYVSKPTALCIALHFRSWFQSILGEDDVLLGLDAVVPPVCEVRYAFSDLHLCLAGFPAALLNEVDKGYDPHFL